MKILQIYARLAELLNFERRNTQNLSSRRMTLSSISFAQNSPAEHTQAETQLHESNLGVNHTGVKPHTVVLKPHTVVLLLANTDKSERRSADVNKHESKCHRLR